MLLSPLRTTQGEPAVPPFQYLFLKPLCLLFHPRPFHRNKNFNVPHYYKSTVEGFFNIPAEFKLFDQGEKLNEGLIFSQPLLGFFTLGSEENRHLVPGATGKC